MPRLKQIIRILRYIVTAITVLVLLVALWAWWRWNTRPGYWHEIEPAGQQAADEAERFENWIASQGSAVREGDGSWAMRIELKQINQWLAERSKAWAANQGVEYPDWLDHPMVALEPGRIIVAGHVHRDSFDNIMSLVYEPRVDSQRGVVLDLTEIRVGSLGIPAEMVLEKVLRGYSPSDEQKIRRTIQHIQMRGKVDSRRIMTVEQLTIDPKAGEVTMDCRTVRNR